MKPKPKFKRCWYEEEIVDYLAAMRGDDAEVSGDPVSSFHLHQVSCHHLLGVDLHLLPLADNKSLLKSRELKPINGKRSAEYQNNPCRSINYI